MIRFLISTDAMLLRAFQAAADFAEISFGLNCFVLAKISIALRLLLAFVFALVDQYFISIVLFSFIFVYGGKMQRSDFDGMRNALESLWEPRIVVFMSTFASLIVAYVYPQGYAFSKSLFLFMDFVFVYLMSCTPLPPGTKESKRLPTLMRSST